MSKLGFKELLTAFQAEAFGLSVLGPVLIYNALESGFGKYEKYLRKQRKSGVFKRVETLVRQCDGELDTRSLTTEVRTAFNLAHLAVCNGLFDGWELSDNQINKNFLDYKVNTFLRLFEFLSADQLETIFSKLHVADAARTIHTLQLLGLCNWDSAEIRQLSLACGPGNRDIEGLHQVPAPRLVRSKNPLGGERKTVRFEKKIYRPMNIVLVDNDPDISNWFSGLNTNNSDWLHAFNSDAETVFSLLPEFQNSRGWGLRNAVVGLRIDHRMVPDIERFFHTLAPSLDKAVELILTIGAGHSLEEFEGRVKVMGEMFHYLRDKKLTPVHIKLHGPGSVEEQRNSPLFGFSPITTYEILYCHVYRDRLV